MDKCGHTLDVNHIDASNLLPGELADKNKKLERTYHLEISDEDGWHLGPTECHSYGDNKQWAKHFRIRHNL